MERLILNVEILDVRLSVPDVLKVIFVIIAITKLSDSEKNYSNIKKSNILLIERTSF